MYRTARLIGSLALAGIVTGATHRLPLGDAERGREVFRTLGCANCHKLSGDGNPLGVDLSPMVLRGFSPDRMTGELWNHAPAMWKIFDQRAAARPELIPQQAADLFIYFFSLKDFELPGDARHGQRLFHSYRCSHCHAANSSPGTGAPPVREWRCLDHPIILAQRMWSHQRLDKLLKTQPPGAKLPPLSAKDLTDMLVYLRAAVGRTNVPVFQPGSPADGAKVFVNKGCFACHHGNESLEGRPTRYSLNDYAASLWSHRPVAPAVAAPLSAAELRGLAGYLVSIQFVEERGDAKRGQALFEKKRCIACHDNPSSGAPPRSSMAGRMTSFDMAAALWNHGPAMIEAARRLNIPWPRFEYGEMADLTAFLHGYEFKRRPASASPDSPPPSH